MKTPLLLAALLALTAPTHAQSNANALTTGAAGQENLNALVRGAPTVVPDTRYEGLRGSPYVVARWLPATITMTRSHVVLPPVALKYDVFRHRLLMRTPQKGDSLQLDENLVESFVLTDALLPNPATGRPAERYFRRFLEAPELQQKLEFVEVLHAGKYALLKRYVRKLEKADYQGAYNTDRRYDELTSKEEYYLRRPDGKLEAIKPTLKALQAAAPALAPALKAEAGKQKTSGKSDAELARLLDAVDPV